MKLAGLCVKTGCAAAAMSLAAAAFAAELLKPAADYFGEYSGCALILTRDRHREWNMEFGPAQCALPQSPCSTFKIPNALIGLHAGVLSGPDHKKAWDGTVHQRKVNNRDHSLATAIKYSVVWYFQSIAREVGTAEMQEWLDRLDYGNRDISGGIDRFWLGSSLAIDAHGQMDLLKSLSHGTLPFRPAVQQQVQEMLVQESELPGVLHAKTGSCPGLEENEPDHGWFVGWIDWQKNRESNPATTWFVINIRGEQAWGSEARPIALQLLHDLQP